MCCYLSSITRLLFYQEKRTGKDAPPGPSDMLSKEVKPVSQKRKTQYKSVCKSVH